jgi:hypothetical protein
MLTASSLICVTTSSVVLTSCPSINTSFAYAIRGLLEKYPTFGREKETGLLGALDT